MADALPDNVPAQTGPAGGKPPLFGLSFLDNLADMTMLRQVGLMVGLAASVAIGFAVVLWSLKPYAYKQWEPTLLGDCVPFV